MTNIKTQTSAAKRETVWGARVGFDGEIEIENVEVVSRTANQIRLAERLMSFDYLAVVPPNKVSSTKLDAMVKLHAHLLRDEDAFKSRLAETREHIRKCDILIADEMGRKK